MPIVRTVCAHDCPDMCSLLVETENGRVTRIQGDPEQPLTAGFACGKVNRDMELVHSPERLKTPLRRIGPKGSGQFAPITWDQALDEIVSRWQALFAEVRARGAAGLCLLRASGTDEPWPDQRLLPRAWLHPPAGRHRLRFLCRRGLGGDVGSRRRRRSGVGHRIRPGDFLGIGPPRDQRASLGEDRGACAAAASS